TADAVPAPRRRPTSYPPKVVPVSVGIATASPVGPRPLRGPEPPPHCAVAFEVRFDRALRLFQAGRPRPRPLAAVDGQLVVAPARPDRRTLPLGSDQPVALHGAQRAVEAARVALEPERGQTLEQIVAVGGRLGDQEEQAWLQEPFRLSDIELSS